MGSVYQRSKSTNTKNSGIVLLICAKNLMGTTVFVPFPSFIPSQITFESKCIRVLSFPAAAFTEYSMFFHVSSHHVVHLWKCKFE